MSDMAILSELADVITDDAARVASSARKLKLRADSVATWLAMVIELAGPDREAVSQIRGAFRERVRTADSFQFMQPRKGKP
jgi:hypothetical protein